MKSLEEPVNFEDMIKLNKDKFSTKYEFCDSSLPSSLLTKFEISGTQINPSSFFFFINNNFF